MTNRFYSSLLVGLTTTVLGGLALAQDVDTSVSSPEPIDEVIVEGVISWDDHDGMSAFLAGDYVTAEIEFEKDFKSLRRRQSTLRNAIESASFRAEQAILSDGAGDLGETVTSSGGADQFQNAASTSVNVSTQNSFGGKRLNGRSLLRDGTVTEGEFAFTKYMAGLSELQQGKYDEAKASFKKSVHHDGTNHDARMRLGLLYVTEQKLDKAADQLESIDKIRLKCKKISCDDYSKIVESAMTLAGAITNSANAQ